jgi:hypothetical protein
MGDGNGYVLRWDCLEYGCFNHKKRPKFAAFAEAFPGKINFSDVDGIVEICGNALLLEWKEEPRSLVAGQRIMYERLSHCGITVFLLAGDARTMQVTAMAFFYHGVFHAWRPCGLAEVLKRLQRWVRWAQAHPKQMEVRDGDR